jgi:hypothetical protein
VPRRRLLLVGLSLPALLFNQGVASAAALTPATSGPSSALTPSAIAQLSKNVTDPVIIVLKNQFPAEPATRTDTPARRALVSNSQAAVTQELSETGATHVRSYTTLNAISATVSHAEAARLASSSAVQAVIPDSSFRIATPQAEVAGVLSTAGATSGTGAATNTPPPGACSTNPSDPQLNPQALSVLNVKSSDPSQKTAASLGIDGSGVTVAFIADGVDINNPDFIRNGKSVFSDYEDFSGDGPNAPTAGGEAFLDASSIAAQGNQTYNVQNYGATPLSTPCYIKVQGVAPGVNLVGLKTFSNNNVSTNSAFLEAIDYAVQVDHVDVINESFGSYNLPDSTIDVMRLFDEQAVAAGVTVVASSGDAGTSSTQVSPSTDPAVISAGATTTLRGYTQAGYGGYYVFGAKGYENNNISGFSSGGWQENGATVDLVAPGDLNWALCSTDTAIYADCTSYAGKPTPVQLSGGTSESAPLTAGVAALIIEAYRNTHGGASPTPALIKQILTSSATDLGLPAQEEGAGLVNAYRAVELAESASTADGPGSPTGDSVLASTGQINATVMPGQAETLKVDLTNEGSTSETITAKARQLGPSKVIKTATVTLSDTSSPHVPDFVGHLSNYEKVTFTVPSGADHLETDIAYHGAVDNPAAGNLNARVRISLIDPSGQLASYSVPQGTSNFGRTEVNKPAPGTWTAYIWSRESTLGGTTGPVLFSANVASYQSYGMVSPASFTLAPGKSRTVSLTTSATSGPGDTAASLALMENGNPTTVPVTIRTLLDLSSGKASFTGTVFGGNGRQAAEGQTFYYSYNVPSGEAELNASLTLSTDAGDPAYLMLVDPAGELAGVATNQTVLSNSSGGSVFSSLGAQSHVLRPDPGRWVEIVVFPDFVSGNEISQQFSGTVDLSTVPVTSTGIPGSTTTMLAAGQPVVGSVTVKNNGPAWQTYFVDARLNSQAVVPLALTSGPHITLPLTFSEFPLFLVPSDTTELASGVTASQPVTFDEQAADGDPDVGSTPSGFYGATADLTDNPVTPGIWDLAPSEIGPFGASGAPSAKATIQVMALTRAFDSSVSSSTGDLWAESATGAWATGALDGGVTPVLVAPGQSTTIPVIIDPQGKSGSKVSGTLFVDDLTTLEPYSSYQPLGESFTGDQVAAVPYSYTIK